MTTRIHAALAQKSLLPSTHLVDTGYVDGPLLAASQRDYEVELLGPTRADYHWQARQQEGFGASNFILEVQTGKSKRPTCKSLTFKAQVGCENCSPLRASGSQR